MEAKKTTMALLPLQAVVHVELLEKSVTISWKDIANMGTLVALIITKNILYNRRFSLLLSFLS